MSDSNNDQQKTTDDSADLESIEQQKVEVRGFTNITANKKCLPWIILFVSALNVIFLGGKRRAFGIFVAELHNGVFNTTSLAELNWIGDSYAALGYLTTTLSTLLIIRFNRQYQIFQFIGACFVLLACVSSAYATSAHLLFLTHTVFHGIGSSLILSTVGLVVNEHFNANHKYHILATTLVSGGSVASIVFVQFYAYLIVKYGWRGSFVILGVLYFVVNCTGVMCFRKRKQSKSENGRFINISSKFRKIMNTEKVALLVLWTGDRIVTSIVTYGMLLNLADYLRRNNSNLTRSTSLTILFAAGEATTYIIGAVIGAVTKKFLLGRLKYILLVSSIFMAFFLVLWEGLANSPMWSMFLAFVSGFCLGPSITFLFPAGEEMTTLPGEIAYPFSLAGMGLGMLLSPTMSAVIAQRFKYKWFFMVQGCLVISKCLFLAASCFILWRYKHVLGISSSNQEDREFLLNSDNERVSMIKREKNSFQPLPITDDGQSVDNGWDHIDLMDAQEVERNGDDCV